MFTRLLGTFLCIENGARIIEAVVKTNTRQLVTLLTLGVFMAACSDGDGKWNLSNFGFANRAPDGVVAIIHAIDAGDIPKLRGLLEGGAVPTPQGSPLSPVHAAITHFRDGQLVCDDAALKLLLDYGADPNFVDQDSGFSALEDALAMGDIPCATLLKDAGASVDQRGHSGQSILQFAVKGAERTHDTEILKLMMSWGVDPNVLGRSAGYTALHEAAWMNPGQAAIAEAVVVELLRSGTDPCKVDHHGESALDLATTLKRSVSIQNLLADAMRECPRN